MPDARESPRTVIVIGAGIVGVSAAIWLQRGGSHVVLIDRAGPAQGASFGNGGVLASCSVSPITMPGLITEAPAMLFNPNKPLFVKWRYLPRAVPFLVRYLRHANRRSAEHRAASIVNIIGDSLADHQALAAGTGAEKWIRPSDYLFLYRDRHDFELSAPVWALRRRHGFEWEELEGDRLRAYDPCFGPGMDFACRLANHGFIADPAAYVRRMADYLVENGGTFLRGEATGLEIVAGRATGVRVEGETVAGDAVVLAAGVWSRKLAAQLGIDVPMESERGYHLELWEPTIMPRSPVMIASGRFVATPMEGRLRLAGIVEIGGIEAPPSRAPFELLLRCARAAMPGLEWREKTEWMGHRPAVADSLPLIGALPGLANVFAGFGHDHIGLTGGPRTGRILAQLVAGLRPNIDLAPFSPARFQ